MIGRSGNREPKHLLDIDAEQNIGNSVASLLPQADGATVIPQTNPERILMLSGPSSAGQTTSIALTASRIVPGPNNPTPGFPGPITGIIEFGNGGQFTRAEVDIPIGPFAGLQKSAVPGVEPQDGGVIVTVPTGVLRVYARYDNQLIQAPLGLPTQSLAQRFNKPFVGPGGPTTLLPGTVIPAEPVQVKAMAAYFSRHTSRVYKTNYCYVGNFTNGGLPTPISLPANSVSSEVLFCVPPFARQLKVCRMPITAALDIVLIDSCYNVLDFISIPSGSAPLIPLLGNETVVQVISHDPNSDLVYFLALCYEIGI
jgi:hypothetical protein